LAVRRREERTASSDAFPQVIRSLRSDNSCATSLEKTEEAWRFFHKDYNNKTMQATTNEATPLANNNDTPLANNQAMQLANNQDTLPGATQLDANNNQAAQLTPTWLRSGY
jgi:hypothetical protein